MSGQQAGLREPEILGYCLQCGGYGRGVYAGPINSYSDAIRDHHNCPNPRSARAQRPRTAR